MTKEPWKLQGLRYVFLDRDGVVNRKAPEGHYITRWEQWEWLPGVELAIAKLNRANLSTILVTNQRAIALGLLSEAELAALHARMQSHLSQQGARLDAIYFCPHDRGVCRCRKPATGLFEQALLRFPDASPANSVMIGDSLSDIEAGRRFGMRTIFLQGEVDRRKSGAENAAAIADAVFASLAEAVQFLLDDSTGRF